MLGLGEVNSVQGMGLILKVGRNEFQAQVICKTSLAPFFFFTQTTCRLYCWGLSIQCASLEDNRKHYCLHLYWLVEHPTVLAYLQLAMIVISKYWKSGIESPFFLNPDEPGNSPQVTTALDTGCLALLCFQIALANNRLLACCVICLLIYMCQIRGICLLLAAFDHLFNGYHIVDLFPVR